MRVGAQLVPVEALAVELARRYDGELLVERMIQGPELTVAVLNGRALPSIRIVPAAEFYDYHAKYAAGGSRHVIPAGVAPEVYAEAQRLSVLAHRTLGCRGVSRADLRYDGNTLYMLEVNTQPGMTPTSLVPEQAAYAGISFQELVSWMVENAECDR